MVCVNLAAPCGIVRRPEALRGVPKPVAEPGFLKHSETHAPKTIRVGRVQKYPAAARRRPARSSGH